MLLLLLLGCTFLHANNIEVTNVRVPDELIPNADDATEFFLDITFDLAWDNSWRLPDLDGTPSNYDGAYVFAYYRIDSTQWRLLNFDRQRLPTAPGGYTQSIGAGPNEAMMIYRANEGSGDVRLNGVQLNGVIDGTMFNVAQSIEVRVFAIEMVFIPRGSFFVGGLSGSETGSFFAIGANDGNTGTAYEVRSSFSVTYGTSPGQLSWMEGPNTGTLANVSAFIGFTGFNAFWTMKYETTEAQYVDFFNTLRESQRGLLDITGPNGKDTDAELNGNTISWTGSGRNMTTTAPERPLNYASQNMVLSYLTWAGLRPLTEFEYEKAARGNRVPTQGEYAWGTDDIATSNYTIASGGSASESITNPSSTAGNANYQGTGGDALGRALRAGIFAASAPSPARDLTGGSYYGLMELSGNLSDLIVSVAYPNVANSSRLQGEGNHLLDGDGYYESIVTWPATQANPTAPFWAYRGGSFNTAVDRLQISNRELGSVAHTPQSDVGFRGATSRSF